MNCKENQYMGPWMNAPGTTLPWYNAPAAKQSPYYQPGMSLMMSGAMAYPTVYPDIYYKLQPHIMRACDEMEMYEMMPGVEMIEHKCDQIHDNVCRMHPDLAEYAREYEIQANNPMDPPEDYMSHNPDGFGFRMFRRRGLFGDLIRILLLSELFRRRRRRRRRR
ncbi:MAG: hypothetical protein ACOYU3_04785 [Bacillota bacterium]